MNAAIIIKDDRLITIGGSRYLNGSYQNQIMQRDMLGGNYSYIRINIMANARASLGACMVDGVVYMIGGRDNQYIAGG
jgi:formylmethanofuran dehydrogenase subunit C